MTQNTPPAPVDVLSLAQAVLGSKRRATRVAVDEVRALSQAVLDLAMGLGGCRLVDRSAPYEPGAARPDGTRPKEEERWPTPREIADAVLGKEEQ